MAEPHNTDQVDFAKVYPYIVPSEYLQYGSPGMARPIGHNLHGTLVLDLGGSVRNVTTANLDAQGVSFDMAYEKALKNLELLAKGGHVKTRLFPQGPGGKPFALFGGHWAAATCLLLPGLYQMLSSAMKTPLLCASIPHRDAMLVFPKGDATSRLAMITMIREKESDGAKPLTFNLFQITDEGVKELED